MDQPEKRQSRPPSRLTYTGKGQQSEKRIQATYQVRVEHTDMEQQSETVAGGVVMASPQDGKSVCALSVISGLSSNAQKNLTDVNTRRAIRACQQKFKRQIEAKEEQLTARKREYDQLESQWEELEKSRGEKPADEMSTDFQEEWNKVRKHLAVTTMSLSWLQEDVEKLNKKMRDEMQDIRDEADDKKQEIEILAENDQNMEDVVVNEVIHTPINPLHFNSVNPAKSTEDWVTSQLNCEGGCNITELDKPLLGKHLVYPDDSATLYNPYKETTFESLAHKRPPTAKLVIKTPTWGQTMDPTEAFVARYNARPLQDASSVHSQPYEDKRGARVYPVNYGERMSRKNKKEPNWLKLQEQQREEIRQFEIKRQRHQKEPERHKPPLDITKTKPCSEGTCSYNPEDFNYSDDDGEIDEKESTSSSSTRSSQKGGTVDIETLVAALGKLGTRGTGGVDKKLPSFNGDPSDWCNFRSEYKRTTKKYQFDDDENMARLRDALKGDAKQEVQHLMANSKNMRELWQTLRASFGRPELVLDHLVKKAKDIKSPELSKPETLVAFGRTINALVTNICSFNETDYLNNKQLVTELISKLPGQLQGQWYKWLLAEKTRKTNLTFFSEWLKPEVEAARYQMKPKESFQKEEKKSGGGRSTRGPGAIHSTTGVEEKDAVCPACQKKGHPLDKCYAFPKKNDQEKWKIVKDSGVCFGCLKYGHRTKGCTGANECGKDGCDKKHHPLLHPKKSNMHTTNRNQRPSSPQQQGNNSEEAPVSAPGTMAVTIVEGTDGILPIVECYLRGERGSIKTYAMLDSGASRTLITKKLADSLGLKGEAKPYPYFGIKGERVPNASSRRVSFDVKGAFSRASYHDITDARTIEELPLKPYSMNVDELKKRWPHLKPVKVKNMVRVVPEILIGSDNQHLMFNQKILFLDKTKPTAMRCPLGWVLGGKVHSTNETGNYHPICGADDLLFKMIKESFSLDNLGVKLIEKIKSSVEDKRSMDILEKTFKKENGICELGLLWKNENVALPESKTEAIKRLYSIEKRMTRDPEFAALYKLEMDKLKKKGYIRKLLPDEIQHESRRTWYLPHFGVQNPNKPGKLRLVFDAASKSNGTCLNDHLMSGPNLIRPLTTVIWNWRLHKYVITCDVEDMFPRVRVKKEDQAAQRFLWRDGDTSQNPDVYEMEVLVFGETCSPAGAIYAMRRNAGEYREDMSEAVRAIEEDFYVDDGLTGGASIKEVIKLSHDLACINAKGNFQLKKFISNNKEILAAIPPDKRGTGIKDFREKTLLPSERVLGLWWDPEEDAFTFRTNFHKVSEKIMKGGRPSKRQMCSLVMSLYDPLGFIGHFRIKGMILLQRAVTQTAGWDDEISDDIYEDWKEWVAEIPEIKQVKVGRHYFAGLEKADSVELHTFVDASEEAYAAVCYLRITNGNKVKLAFVTSKVRVKPLKKTTIPRLELQAALLGTRIATSICEELRIPIKSRKFWSDSKTVLCWLRNESNRYKEFVANRVGEIQENTNTNEWGWVPTELNVADIATRLKKETDFNPESPWFTGPEFLLKENAWPTEKAELQEAGYVAALVGAEALGDAFRVGHSTDEGCGLGAGKVNIAPPIWRFSSYNKMIRATAAVHATAQFWKNKKCNSSPWKMVEGKLHANRKNKNFATILSNLHPTSLKYAEECLAQQVQQEMYADIIELIKAGKYGKKAKLWKLAPFLDEKGIIRLRGRLNKGRQIPVEAKNPILLPPNHHFTKLLIHQEHVKNGHQGQRTVLANLRQKWWIIDGKAAVKRCQRECWECKVRTAKPIMPEMGDLPHYRLESRVAPFTHTGVDFFGPIEVTVGRHHEKRWGAMFCCMVTRAIHVEISHGLSTDDFLMALSRFVDARGKPCHLYSDNGTNFVGAARELKEIALEVGQSEKCQGIEWHFQPPSAPHMGGVWERLVQTVKRTLSGILKEKYPRDQTLLTVIKAVENIVNSRPLTYMSDDPTDPEAVTPNHFIRGGSFMSGDSTVMGVNVGVQNEWYKEQWKYAQLLANRFWDRWSREYLPELLHRQKWHQSSEPLQVGEVVIIVDDQQPRNIWSKAIITKTFPDSSGQVRVVEASIRDFKTKRVATYKRPVAKICPLGLRSVDSGLLKQS